MSSFEHKLAESRKVKSLSQKELAEIFSTSHKTTGKYERDKMISSTEASKKLAKILDTTVGYLLGENEQANLFNDTKMLKRFQDVAIIPDKEGLSLITTIEHFIKAARINLM